MHKIDFVQEREYDYTSCDESLAWLFGERQNVESIRV